MQKNLTNFLFAKLAEFRAAEFGKLSREVCEYETLMWLASSSSPAGEEKPLTQIIQQFMQLSFSGETFTTANLPTAPVMKPQSSALRSLQLPPAASPPTPAEAAPSQGCAIPKLGRCPKALLSRNWCLR